MARPGVDIDPYDPAALPAQPEEAPSSRYGVVSSRTATAADIKNNVRCSQERSYAQVKDYCPVHVGKAAKACFRIMRTKEIDSLHG